MSSFWRALERLCGPKRAILCLTFASVASFAVVAFSPVYEEVSRPLREPRSFSLPEMLHDAQKPALSPIPKGHHSDEQNHPSHNPYPRIAQ